MVGWFPSNVPHALAVVAMLMLVACQRDTTCAGNYNPTTLTATTTSGVSLLQVLLPSFNKENVAVHVSEVTKSDEASEVADPPAERQFDASLNLALGVEESMAPNTQVHLESFSSMMSSVSLQISTFLTNMYKVSPAKSTASLFFIVLVLVAGATCFYVTRPDTRTNDFKFQEFDRPVFGLPRRSPKAPGAMAYEAKRMGNESSSDDSEVPSKGGGAADAHFCPDLVVPEQCECILVVPVYAPNGAFNICDMNGRAVLNAFTQTSSARGAPRWSLDVKTATGELLAKCIEVGTQSVEYHILDSKRSFFASIVELHGQQRYEMTTRGGSRIHLWGNFLTQAVNVTDEQGVLLATTEPCGIDLDRTGSYYRLRVAPLVNVGHSLCALLCIGQILGAK